MKEVEERRKAFVGFLLSLAQEGREDRGALAALRSGLARAPGEAHRTHKYVVPYLGDRGHPSDRWFYVVGALFAYHPEHQSGRSFGASFKELADQEGASDSIEARFVALLNSHPDDLPDHLRQAVGLLRSKNVPVDWFRLLDDLTNWGHPDRFVQSKWARDFYHRERPAPTVSGE
jgi:CRISPR system Cascade subunit CasB